MAANNDAQTNAENILQFKETFNLQSFVQKYLAPDNRDAESHVLNVHVVGQEADGSILVSWDGKASEDNPVIVTKVGYYTAAQGKPVYQELYKYNERADICSATVNSALTLLAFTVRELEKDVGETSYVSFCAEIHPQGRTFVLELNCDRFHVRKLQFLPTAVTARPTPRQPKHAQQQHSQPSCQCYTSKLLVIVPQAFILTYSIMLQQTCKISENGTVTQAGTVVLDTEEDKTHVTPHPLDWYQWDHKQQWLYYARLDVKPNILILSCIAFTSDPYEQVLSLCLPLLYHADYYKVRAPSTSSSHHSITPPIDLTTPAHQLNIQVIYRRKEDHLMCVCVQHRAQHDTPASPTTNSPQDQDYTLAENEMVEYSVYMVHNGHVIHGQVPFTVLPTSNLRVHFMMLGKFVAAYIPGVMLHLLNIHPQVDPCHHLVLEASMSPPLPVPGGAIGMVVRTNSPAWTAPVLCNVASVQSGFDSTSIMDCKTQAIYECTLCPGALLEMFKNTTNASLRIDLLHLAIVSLRLQNLAFSMLEHVCQSPVTLDTHKIFAEFILAFAYNNTLVSHVQRFITNQLPLTTTWPSFNGGVYRNENGMTYALLKIAQLEETFVKRLLVMVQVTQHKMDSAEDLLACKFAAEGGEAIQDMLYFNVITTQPRLRRIKVSTLLDWQADVVSRQTAAAASVQKRGGPLRRIMGAMREVANRRVSKPPPTGLPFLEPDSDLDLQVTVAVQNLREILVGAIGSQLGSSSKSLVGDQLDTYYITELGRESCELLKLVWQSLGLGRDTHPLNNTLYRPATPLEHVLYELLEAYLHAHLELGIPTPSGFHTLYTCLGFLCLEPIVFLQYFAHGAFQITVNFVEKAIQSSDDARLHENGQETKKKDELLYNIICDLPEPDRTKAFASWSNPEVKLMVCGVQEDTR